MVRHVNRPPGLAPPLGVRVRPSIIIRPEVQNHREAPKLFTMLKRKRAKTENPIDGGMTKSLPPPVPCSDIVMKYLIARHSFLVSRVLENKCHMGEIV